MSKGTTRQHILKILPDFADAIVSGDKTFEIRKNDRGFQRGDSVEFQCITSEGEYLEHPINHHLYLITYILNGWGLEKDYVVFSIEDAF